MNHVVRGLLNKQIAGVLGLSEITVKLHRGSIMRMGVRTLPDLVRSAEFSGAVAAPTDAYASRNIQFCNLKKE